MPTQEHGFHPSTDCHQDGNGDCGWYLIANNIWFERDNGDEEYAEYMNFSISLFTSQGALDNCENNPPEDGECFPRLGGWHFSFNFCLNGNYGGAGHNGGYSPLVIDRVTAAGDNTGFQGGFEYSFWNYSPNDTQINPLLDANPNTQCLSASVTATAFGGASSGWSMHADYPGMTLANVRVKYKGDGVDVINPDLIGNPGAPDGSWSQHPFRGTFGIGGHPYTSIYDNYGQDPDPDAEAQIDLSPDGESPPPIDFSPHIDLLPSPRWLCEYDSPSGGMGPGYYCMDNAYYSGANGGSRSTGFRCRNHVYPADDSTYVYGMNGEEALQAYCNSPDNDEPCGYCDAQYPLSCMYTDGLFVDAHCDEGYNHTSPGERMSDLNNCRLGNWDCVSDLNWTLSVGQSGRTRAEDHPGPSYPSWSGGNAPPGDIVLDIVRYSSCCADEDFDSDTCYETCGSYLWDIEGNYIAPWTWLPTTWIISSGDGDQYCNSDEWIGCGDQCCCENPPRDPACLNIQPWYDIFGCMHPQGCNYNPSATENTGCSLPQGSYGNINAYNACQRGQGCPTLWYDQDGDGVSAGASSQGGTKYFCPQGNKGTAGWACKGAGETVGSFPLFDTLALCEASCETHGDESGYCIEVISFGQKVSPGEEVPQLNNANLLANVISTCNPDADYSDFGYNHCEQRGTFGGAGSSHPSFTCPTTEQNNLPHPGSCFVENTGDPEPDCVWDTWECDPVTGDDEGLCLPWQEIENYRDQCGTCNGDGAMCSAHGYCDQDEAPIELGSEWSQCQLWGSGITWDWFDWEYGCGNSYCFAQMKCPGGDDFSTDDVCFEHGEQHNTHGYCREWQDCWWDCEDTLGDSSHKCGCTYEGNCLTYIAQNAPEQQWGGLATCDGTGKVEVGMGYCDLDDAHGLYGTWQSYFTGQRPYRVGERCFFDHWPYCGTRPPWNGLGCACDVHCAYFFDCCHGACENCSEAWVTGQIYFPDREGNRPDVDGSAYWSPTANNYWPWCLRYDTNYFYGECAQDHQATIADMMYCNDNSGANSGDYECWLLDDCGGGCPEGATWVPDWMSY